MIVERRDLNRSDDRDDDNDLDVDVLLLLLLDARVADDGGLLSSLLSADDAN